MTIKPTTANHHTHHRQPTAFSGYHGHHSYLRKESMLVNLPPTADGRKRGSPERGGRETRRKRVPLLSPGCDLTWAGCRGAVRTALPQRRGQWNPRGGKGGQGILIRTSTVTQNQRDWWRENVRLNRVSWINTLTLRNIWVNLSNRLMVHPKNKKVTHMKLCFS